MEFFKTQTSIRFMATRKWWYTLSALMIGLSVIALWRPGLNFGVDFTGGVVVEVHYPSPADIDRAYQAVSQAGFPDAQVQNFGSSRDVMIRLEPHEELTGAEVGQRVLGALQQVEAGITLSRVDVVGPQVGEELREKGYLAMLFTFIFILMYIWFRFELKLALGTILAAMHTPIIILGFFAATQMTFDLTVLAAVLAVVGYQINDTVVVFDRVRERFPMMRGATTAQVLDAAINQTLSRTVMTSVSTAIVIAALLAVGGETLRGFSAAILIGIFVGTYASIYIAGATALDMKLSAEDLMAVKRAAPVDDLP